jgi:hypothetical protein
MIYITITFVVLLLIKNLEVTSIDLAQKNIEKQNDNVEKKLFDIFFHLVILILIIADIGITQNFFLFLTSSVVMYSKYSINDAKLYLYHNAFLSILYIFYIIHIVSYI